MADNLQGRSLNSVFGESDLSALRGFVGGYLHQDFIAEHKTLDAALDAFCRDASRKEILELEGDLDRFMDKTGALPFAAAREVFVRELHSGWSPPNRAALAHLMRLVRAHLIKSR